MESTEKKPRGKRGQGTVYWPKNSSNWWIKFSVNGQVIQQSANTESKREALDELKTQIHKHANGEAVAPKIRRITVAELFEAVVTNYRNNGKSVRWVEYVWRLHLEPYFGHMRAASVGTDQLAGYVASRKAEKEPVANATINRELALLRRAFSLGYKSKPRKVAALLDLSEFMLEENNVRTGFVDEAQYRILCETAAGQLWLRAMLALGYTYGFRRGELLTMRVGQVDLLARTIRLNPGETKNGKGRTVTLTESCYVLVLELVKGKQPDDFLITRRSGKPVRDFRSAWHALTDAAKMPANLLFHDLRRSAVRNMVRRGVTEKVAMKISGHVTRSVFDRYDIVNESDLADAALKVERGGRAELARAVEISQKQAKIAENAPADEKTQDVQNETIQ